MIKSEKGVSEVVGMVIILSIMVLTIGFIMLVGVPMIENGMFRAKMDVAMSSFFSLQNDIEEVVRGPIWVRNPADPNITIDKRLIGPSRETEFELIGGTLSIWPNVTNITETLIENNADFRITIPPSNLTYIAQEETILYENGAVIRKYVGGNPMMVSHPLVSIYNTGDDDISISIHAISFNGTLSSVGGEGKARVQTRAEYYDSVVEPSYNPNSNNTYINITSLYPEAWRAFFDEKLRGAGLTPSNKGSLTGYNISGTRPLEIQVYGNSADSDIPDIYLSLYESRLDIKVR